MMNKYLVWCPDCGDTIDDAKSFDAKSAEYAAMAWARRFDDDANSTFLIADGDIQAELMVVDVTDKSKRISVRVYGSWMPTYTACEVGAPKKAHKNAQSVLTKPPVGNASMANDPFGMLKR